jgi:hypothetical protein
MEGVFFNLAQIAAADFGFIGKVVLRTAFRIGDVVAPSGNENRSNIPAFVSQNIR